MRHRLSLCVGQVADRLAPATGTLPLIIISLKFAFIFLQAMAEWYVYMLRCRDGSLYTGIATDVERRCAEHQSGKGAKYLRGRGPLTLVFKQRVGRKSRTLKVEQKIKRLPKQKKEALVKTGAGLDELLGRNL